MAKVTALKQKQEEKQGFSIDDILSTATQPKEAKSSSKVPVLTVSKDVQQKLTRLREIKELLDSLESEWDLLSAETTAQVEPMRADIIKRLGYTSSVKALDTNGLAATLSWSTKYSAVDLSNAPTIEATIGKDRATQFFTREMKITVKDVTEDALRDLIQSVGPERFAQFFAVERWMSPTKAYSEQFYTAFNEKERTALAPIVRQYKPSIRVK
jgi:hypothetical protein